MIRAKTRKKDTRQTLHLTLEESVYLYHLVNCSELQTFAEYCQSLSPGNPAYDLENKWKVFRKLAAIREKIETEAGL